MIEKYYQMVETCITNLGIDPSVCRGEKAGQWSLMKGSAKVWIDVWHIERENRPYFQVMSPVMALPPNTSNEELYKELLEINDKLFGVAFSLYNGWIWLKVIRECDGMDENEAAAMINRIGIYADQYDDHLVAKYSPEGSGYKAPGG